MNVFLFEISSSLTELVSQFLSAIPGAIGAIVITIVGFIVSKLVAKVLRQFLVKINIDKIGEKLNSIDIVDKSNIKIKISEVLSKIIYYFLLVFFLVAATDVLGMPAVSSVVSGIFNFIPNLIVALIVLVIGLLLSEALRSITQTALDSLGMPSAKMISTVLFYFLFVNIIILALSQAKINTDFLARNISVLIGGGVLAFAIGYGFASRDIVANFLASFYSKDRIRIGDKISIDGTSGEVIDIDRSALTLNTPDKKIIVPLSKITTEKLEIYK